MGEHLQATKIELDRLLAETEDVSSGALAVFVGTVRDENEGRHVAGVTYEAHPRLATKALMAIEREAVDRFEVRHCRIVHRTGLVSLGEASVVIVIRSAHRDAAFLALRHAIEELKRRAPIWKLEHYADGGDAYLGGVPLVSPIEVGR